MDRAFCLSKVDGYDTLWAALGVAFLPLIRGLAQGSLRLARKRYEETQAKGFAVVALLDWAMGKMFKAVQKG